MKFLGVPEVFDYAGLSRNSRYRPVHVAFRTLILRRRPGCKFSQLNRPPRLYPCLRFTEFLAVSAQDSGPSGSLVLSRKNFAFSASCRFIPAHINCHSTHNPGIGSPVDGLVGKQEVIPFFPAA